MQSQFPRPHPIFLPHGPDGSLCSAAVSVQIRAIQGSGSPTSCSCPDAFAAVAVPIADEASTVSLMRVVRTGRGFGLREVRLLGTASGRSGFCGADEEDNGKSIRCMVSWEEGAPLEVRLGVAEVIPTVRFPGGSHII